MKISKDSLKELAKMQFDTAKLIIAAAVIAPMFKNESFNWVSFLLGVALATLVALGGVYTNERALK